MNKILLILIFTLIQLIVPAQKYITKNGYISFFGSTPLENIKAENNQVASILDAANGDLVFQGLIKSFHFEKKLMEEHFNENFVDSDKYPRFQFKGKILNISEVNFSKSGTHNADVRGEMTINNITRQIEAKGTLELLENAVVGKSKFNIRPEDYNIKIPGVLREKVAKEMEVTVDARYSPMN